jgi:quercetin dioxygenase-like cupin family protein
MFVKANPAVLLAMCCVPLTISAQMSNVISLASEPHHRLALHNKYVNVYEVEVAPHGTVQLHRHEFDAISIMMSNSEVIVRVPGKPDVRQKLSEGQVRLQSRGYVHSTSIEGDTTYRNVTVELLSPQQGARNLCAAVIASQELNCSRTELSLPGATHIDQGQFETKQTRVTLIRLMPHQTINVGDPSRSVLIVALDDALSTLGGDNPRSSMRSGDFAWLEKGLPARALRNTSGNEARFISFLFEH